MGSFHKRAVHGESLQVKGWPGRARTPRLRQWRMGMNHLG